MVHDWFFGHSSWDAALPYLTRASRARIGHSMCGLIVQRTAQLATTERIARVAANAPVAPAAVAHNLD